MMKNIRAVLSSLPNTLIILLTLFAALPLWSLTFLPAPWDLTTKYDTASAAILAFTYWGAPLGLCVTILSQSAIFLPLMVLEFAALVFHAATSAGQLDPAYAAIRYAFIGLVAFIGFVFARRDLVLPFLSRTHRFWRKAPRLFANVKLRLLSEDGKHAIPIMMEDCSLSGMAIAGDKSQLDDKLKGKGRGAPVKISLKHRTKEAFYHCRIAWVREVGPLLRVGLSVEDVHAMRALIAEVTGRQHGRLARFWFSSSIQRSVTGLWALALAGAFGIPACGTQESSTVSAGDSTKMSMMEEMRAEESTVAIDDVGDGCVDGCDTSSGPGIVPPDAPQCVRRGGATHEATVATLLAADSGGKPVDPNVTTPSKPSDMGDCSPNVKAPPNGGFGDGTVDEKGNCQFGKPGEGPNCHIHVYGCEFCDGGYQAEMHCVFPGAPPHVVGTPFDCSPGTAPSGWPTKAEIEKLNAEAGTGSHGGMMLALNAPSPPLPSGGNAPKACPEDIVDTALDGSGCNWKCCTNGHLTAPDPNLDVRPSFAICDPTERRVIDCSMFGNLSGHSTNNGDCHLGGH